MDFGNILGFGFVGLWVCLLIFAIWSWSKYFSVKSKEQKMYKKMVVNPNDEIVLEYIDSFQKSYGWIDKIGRAGKHYASQHRDDKLRQSQGYEIVCESPNVSDSVKQNLYNVFVSEGVPVKRK